MLRLFIISICICCLFFIKFISYKNIKRLMKATILSVFFLILQIIGIFLKELSFYYNIVSVLSAICTIFIMIGLLNKNDMIKKIIIF